MSSLCQPTEDRPPCGQRDCWRCEPAILRSENAELQTENERLRTILREVDDEKRAATEALAAALQEMQHLLTQEEA